MLPKLKSQWIILIRLMMFGILILKVSAGTLGVLTYEIIGGNEVEIEKCDVSATGAVVIPDEIGGLPVTRIDSWAFVNCANVTSVTLPSTLTDLGSHTFLDCTSLTSIQIPAGVTTIKTSTFSDCTSLASVTLHNNIVEIDDAAFISCSGLVSINLPPSLQILGDQVFRHCSGLTSITLPGGISSLGTRTFENCTGLTTVVVTNGITELPSGLFNNCDNLTDVSLPTSLLEIDSTCFAFCSNLVNITIPSSVTNLSTSAFRNCIKLINIHVDAANTTYTSINGVVFNDDLTELIIFPNGRSGSYAIPEGVTHIGSRAFESFCRIAEISIPGSVTNIGTDAFIGCISLLAINVEPSNVTFSSNDGVLFNIQGTMLIFYPKGRLGDYTVPNGVKTIFYNAFRECDRLTGITFPDGLTTIGSFAFFKCTQLVRVEMPNSVTQINSGTFITCTNLTEVVLSENITRIRDNFQFCRKLEKINLPSGLTEIGTRAFSNCLFESVVFPETLIEIGSRAYDSNYQLTKAYFLGDAPIYGTDALTTRYPDIKITTIYYLSGSSGFTSPTWNGHNTVMIDEAVYPSAAWLLKNEIDYETPMDQDLNGDGVTLETAEALGLDPNERLSDKLPTATLTGSTLSMEFYGITPGYEYKVFTSSNLTNWTETGVTISAADAEGMRTASTPVTGDKKFLRLTVARETP